MVQTLVTINHLKIALILPKKNNKIIILITGHHGIRAGRFTEEIYHTWMCYYRKNIKIWIIFCIQHDDDWVRNYSTLYKDLFYQNYLHLAKLENEKFRKSINAILFKINANIKRKLYYTIRVARVVNLKLFFTE